MVAFFPPLIEKKRHNLIPRKCFIGTRSKNQSSCEVKSRSFDFVTLLWSKDEISSALRQTDSHGCTPAVATQSASPLGTSTLRKFPVWYLAALEPTAPAAVSHYQCGMSERWTGWQRNTFYTLYSLMESIFSNYVHFWQRLRFAV